MKRSSYLLLLIIPLGLLCFKWKGCNPEKSLPADNDGNGPPQVQQHPHPAPRTYTSIDMGGTNFWTGRVKWLSDETRIEAWQLRRRYPPAAWEDPEIVASKTLSWSWGSEFERWIDDEYAAKFWQKWTPLLPRPPIEIQKKQSHLSGVLAGIKRNRIEGRKLSARLLHSALKKDITSHISQGYPPEAFSDQALISDNKKCWQGAYLSRLIDSKVDESYINAYMVAWGIKRSEIQPCETSSKLLQSGSF